MSDRRVTRSVTKLKLQQKRDKAFNFVTLKRIFSELDPKTLKSAAQVRYITMYYIDGKENIKSFFSGLFEMVQSNTR